MQQTRSTPRAALLRALEEGNPELAEYPQEFLSSLADLLATSLAAILQNNENFPSRLRSLCFNLRANQHLRRQVCAETISPRELCEMGPSLWASTQLQSRREVTAQKQLRSRIRTGLEGALHTRSITCVAPRTVHHALAMGLLCSAVKYVVAPV